MRTWLFQILSRRRPLHSLPTLAAAAFLAAVFAMLLAVFARMFHARLLYPLDLEWMEGGMLVHVQRLLEGHGVYTAPSADFIPFAYTPLYYVVVAVPASLLGVSFAVARAVSLLSLAAIALAYGRAFWPTDSPRTPGPGRWYAAWAALACLALLLLEYFATGAWLDLARADTLFLALTLWGAVVLVRGPGSFRAMVVSGVLFSLAFWTKQTAFFFILAAGAWQAARDWRRLIVLVGTVALLCGGGLLLLQWTSDGWAWFYVREIHRLHTFDATRAWSTTPAGLADRLWPLVALGAVGLAWSAIPWRRPDSRRPDSRVAFWWWFAAAGLLAAAVGSGTQWAHTNALLPAAVFLPPAVAASWLAWAREGAARPLGDETGVPPSRPRLHAAFLAAGFALLLFHVHSRHPSGADFRQATPTRADVAAAERFIATLRRMPGPILIPYHPWSAVLAGSPAHFHQHALNDLRGAKRPVPVDLVSGLKSRRWGTIVHDRHGHAFWRQWPGFTAHYRNTSAVRGRRLRTFAGNPCGPRTFWTPVSP